MKKKNLKSFIEENRQAFDDAIPPENLWDQIAGRLDAQQEQPAPVVRKLRFGTALKIAATALFFCAAGLLAYNYGRKQAYDDYSRINPKLAAEQKAYAQLVTQKKDSIAFIAASDPVLYGEFSDVLQQMENNYKTLKQGLSQSPNQEMTLEAMIHNLRAQIEVLSQQMDVYNYIKETEKTNGNEQQI